MRVLLTTYGFPDDRQAFIEQYVRSIAALGTEVCVVATAGRHRDRPQVIEARGSPVPTVVRASWEDPRIRKLVTLLGSLRGAMRHQPTTLRRLVQQIWRERGFSKEFLARLYVLAPILSRPTDVVHLGWLTSAADWAELVAAIEGPLVVSCHGSDLRLDPLDDNAYRDRLHAVFARADLVHCVSDDLASRAVALGADAGKVLVRAWGADADRFQPPCPTDRTGSDPRPLRIVSVGRLHWVKGYDFLLLALAKVRRAGVAFECTIIGDGTPRDRRSVLATIRDLELEGHVQLRGALPQDDVLAAMRGADLFLMSSVSEGLSTVTLEAMAVGLPVIITDVGGMREAVTDGVEGRVVPPRDPTALADAVCELASDEQLRATMGRRGRQRVIERFDSGATARIMLEQYHRAIARCARQQPARRPNGHRALS